MGFKPALLAAAVVLFILNTVTGDGNLGSLGLACFAGAFLVDELGLAKRRVAP